MHGSRSERQMSLRLAQIHAYLSWTKTLIAKHKKAPSIATRGFYNMAQRTGLEPATPGVTGRYSNQLNYRCASVQRLRSICWR